MSIDIEQEHYTLGQLAKMWQLSYEAVRQMFQNEPGVVKLRAKPQPKGHRRGYTTWRIPKEVAERVYRRSTVS